MKRSDRSFIDALHAHRLEFAIGRFDAICCLLALASLRLPEAEHDRPMYRLRMGKRVSKSRGIHHLLLLVYTLPLALPLPARI